MADHMSLRGALKRSKGRGLLAVLVIVVFVAVVTVARLMGAYDDFLSEAFSVEWAVLLLIAVNVVVMGIAIAFLVAVLKPPNVLAYAIVVILSWLVAVAAPIGVQTIAGTELPGQPESIKLSDVYNPWENPLRDEIDDAVEDKKASEIKALIDRYADRGKAGKAQLLDRLDESLSDEGPPEDEVTQLRRQAKATLNATPTPYPQRLRQVAQQLYVAGQRDAVKDLAG